MTRQQSVAQLERHARVRAAAPPDPTRAEARQLSAGVREALLILLADAAAGGRGFTWSAASNHADAGLDGSRRRVSGRATTALERRRLVTTESTRRLGRIVRLTDRGRQLARALDASRRPAGERAPADA